MSKITLLYHPNEHSNFTAVHLEPHWKKYFNIEPIDPDKHYDHHSTVVVSKHSNVDKWYEHWQQQGYRVAIDNFWDNGVDCTSSAADNKLILRAPDWAWFNEAIWYQSLGYTQLSFSRRPTKFFITLMRRRKSHRTELYEKIKKFSHHSLVSYTEQGVFIDGDIDTTDLLWQRYVNTDWYNSTCFSLVAETHVLGRTFLSEKTFKPIAFQQPFIVFGTTKTLAYLHQKGFETFDNMFDENYDTVENHASRLDYIMSEVDRLHHQFLVDPGYFCSTVVMEKIQHNFNNFYNDELLQNMFFTQALTPLLEFVETK